MRTHTGTHSHSCTLMYTYTHVHTWSHAHSCARTYTHSCTHIHTRVHTHSCTHAHTHVHTLVHTHSHHQSRRRPAQPQDRHGAAGILHTCSERAKEGRAQLRRPQQEYKVLEINPRKAAQLVPRNESTDSGRWTGQETGRTAQNTHTAAVKSKAIQGGQHATPQEQRPHSRAPRADTAQTWQGPQVDHRPGRGS